MSKPQDTCNYTLFYLGWSFLLIRRTCPFRFVYLACHELKCMANSIVKFINNILKLGQGKKVVKLVLSMYDCPK